MSLDFSERSCQFSWPVESAFACFVAFTLRYKKRIVLVWLAQRETKNAQERLLMG